MFSAQPGTRSFSANSAGCFNSSFNVLVSASAGFHGRRSALYGRRLEHGTRFERCETGLPRWFDDNIDTACLAAAGPLVVFGTGDGRVFRSHDTGRSWELAAKGLPPVSGIVVA